MGKEHEWAVCVDLSRHSARRKTNYEKMLESFHRLSLSSQESNTQQKRHKFTCIKRSLSLDS